MADYKLTPAGKQVEEALAKGFTNAACNFYLFNTREDIPMVEGDDPAGGLSVWPEWHRMITEKIDFHNPTNQEGWDEAQAEADRLGLEEGEDRDDFVEEFIEDFQQVQPTLVEKTVRGPSGLIIGSTLVVNPFLDGQEQS